MDMYVLRFLYPILYSITEDALRNMIVQKPFLDYSTSIKPHEYFWLFIKEYTTHSGQLFDFDTGTSHFSSIPFGLWNQ